jgi:hypothetical protein
MECASRGVLLGERQQQPEQLASRFDLMQVDFDFWIERSTNRSHLVEHLSARVVVALIEPLHEVNAAEDKTVIHPPRHRIERTGRSMWFQASAAPGCRSSQPACELALRRRVAALY